MSWAKIVDCGDAPLTFLDNTIALKQLDKAHKVILRSRKSVISDQILGDLRQTSSLKIAEQYTAYHHTGRGSHYHSLCIAVNL
jgi:hypothetical protein